MKSLSRNMIRTSVAVTAAGCAGFALVAPAATASTVDGHRTLLAATQLADLSAAQITGILQRGGTDTGAVRTGATTFRLTYRTTDVKHRPTTASGLIVLPHTP